MAALLDITVIMDMDYIIQVMLGHMPVVIIIIDVLVSMEEYGLDQFLSVVSETNLVTKNKLFILSTVSSSQYYYNYYNYPYAGRPYYDDYSYGYGMYGRGGRHLYGDPYYQNRHGDGHHGDRYPYYDYNY